MPLPEGFIFSQSNLQDYVDCQRRFQLKHIRHLAWPAVEAEPFLENERLINQGAKFHQIVRQYLVGVPKDQISHSVSGDDVMQSWWWNFLNSVKDGILEVINRAGHQGFEEITVSMPIGEFRLNAKYDLLVLTPEGKFIILDWKTSQNHPRRRWLSDRLQTHVYPYVLAASASRLFGANPPDPSQIEMIYWFANQPQQAERYPYNQSNYLEDGSYLGKLISSINSQSEAVFPLTPDVKRCMFCTYRSLCNRGVIPGDLHQYEGWLSSDSPDELNLEFDQIGEIEF